MSKDILNVVNQILKKQVIRIEKYEAVILTGSYYNITNLSDLQTNSSDLDIIILNNHNTFHINTTFDKIRYDISVINCNDFIELFLSAINKSPFNSKVFSSLRNFNILFDTNKIGATFIDIAKKLYNILVSSILPNHKSIHLLQHNIQANISDISKEESLEKFFAFLRSTDQFFEYLVSISYPFHTSGSYRGKILSQDYKDLKEEISREKENMVLDWTNISSLIKRYIPILNTEYIAMEYNPKIVNDIKSGQLTSFFFGFDNLMSEKFIIFVDKEVFKEIEKTENKKIIELNNIVPFLSESHLNLYYSYIKKISLNTIDYSLEQRIKIFKEIYSHPIFRYHTKEINQSLKSILILISFREIVDKNISINLKDLKSWLKEFDNIEFNFLEHTVFDDELNQLANYINKEKNTRIKVIIINYIFFGIMKALRVKIEDLNF